MSTLLANIHFQNLHLGFKWRKLISIRPDKEHHGSSAMICHVLSKQVNPFCGYFPKHHQGIPSLEAMHLALQKKIVDASQITAIIRDYAESGEQFRKSTINK